MSCEQYKTLFTLAHTFPGDFVGTNTKPLDLAYMYSDRCRHLVSYSFTQKSTFDCLQPQMNLLEACHVINTVPV